MQSANELPPCAKGFIPLDGGRVWIAPEYEPIFKTNGLLTFAAIMGYCGGQRFKKNAYREVWRIELSGCVPLFLKKHFRTRLWDRLEPWLLWQKPETSAYHELVAISHLQTIGIDTMKPVAFGEQVGRTGETECFSLTEAIQGIKLEHLLEQQPQRWQEDFAFRQALTAKLAGIARTMHAHHLHHQDFYLGHIMLSWETPNQFRLWLIDLQRMHKRRWFWDRWWIKDLSQLSYGCPPQLVTQADRLRFWYGYQQRNYLTAQDRKWFAWIAARLKKTERHDLRKVQRNNAGRKNED